MDLAKWIQDIRREPEFKELCDALLRLEVGPLVQLYDGKGADGGVDADYVGSFGGVTGRWVFQYKFIHPSTDPNKARARLKKMFMPSAKGGRKSGSEFAKSGVEGACGYVLLTNAPVTVHLTRSLRAEFETLHSGAKLCIWDPASLGAILRAHPHLARSRSKEMEAQCLEEVIAPLWKWIGWPEKIVSSWQEQENPIWPLKFENEQCVVVNDSLTDPYSRKYEPQIKFHRPPSVEQSRVFEYAVGIAFSRALTGLALLQRALADLANEIEAPIRSLAKSLQKPGGSLRKFSQAERDRMALGLAFALLESAWGHSSHLSDIAEDRIRIRGIDVYTGNRGNLAKKPINNELARLRKRYDFGKKLPASVTHARARLADAVHSFADALWHPAIIGVDAPRKPLSDESGSEEVQECCYGAP